MTMSAWSSCEVASKEPSTEVVLCKTWQGRKVRRAELQDACIILIRTRPGTGGKRPQAGQILQGRRRSRAAKRGVDRGDLDLAGSLRQITDATPR